MPRDLANVLEAGWKIVATKDKTLIREACKQDLFFLLRFVLIRDKFLENQWTVDRCDEVEAEPDGYLDLWPREHMKSTIGTFAKTIQDILTNPERTFCIFSFNRPAAKKHMRPIKEQCESNHLLIDLFDDILFRNPKAESSRWSMDDGIVVKRKGSPKEATLEAHGLIDGAPVGAHYDVRIYDDVITQDFVGSSEMREKSRTGWRHSLSLGKVGGRSRYYGTRWHYDDPYAEIIRVQAATPRVYTVEYENSVRFFSDDEVRKRRREHGPVVFAAQYMMNPKSDDQIGFKDIWLRFYEGEPKGNKYVIVDPANKKKKKSDYTAWGVVTLSADGNYYVDEIGRDRLGLTERCELVFSLHKKYRPRRVGYEEYGMQADIEALKWRMQEENYRFDVAPLGFGMRQLGGANSKDDRIMQLMPIFEQGRIYLPYVQHRMSLTEGLVQDMVHVFRYEEYLAWPYASHDDMMDMLSRILDPDLNAVWPKLEQEREKDRYGRARARAGAGKKSWMTI